MAINIFLAEDDRIIADGLLRSLPKAGYAVDAAGSWSTSGCRAASRRWAGCAAVSARGGLGLPIVRKIAEPHRARL